MAQGTRLALCLLAQGRQQWAASARGDADGADALEDTEAHWSARLANALRADSQRTHSGAGERRNAIVCCAWVGP